VRRRPSSPLDVWRHRATVIRRRAAGLLLLSRARDDFAKQE
jgi:hypothetical protein